MLWVLSHRGLEIGVYGEGTGTGRDPVTKGVEYCPWSISGMLKERRRVEEEKK